MKRFLVAVASMILFCIFLKCVFVPFLLSEKTVHLPSITEFKKEILSNYDKIDSISIKHSRNVTNVNIIAKHPLSDQELQQIALDCQTFISSQTFVKEYVPFAFKHSIVDAANTRHMPYIMLSIDRDGDNCFDWSSEARYYKHQNSTEVDEYQTWLNYN